MVIVYNFPLSLGISGLFNLFGLYGNIMKIRTLPKSVRSFFTLCGTSAVVHIGG